MTLTQVANMYLTFAIVLNSEFGSGSVTSYCLNAIYLTVTGIQVETVVICDHSSFMLSAMIQEIIKRSIDYRISVSYTHLLGIILMYRALLCLWLLRLNIRFTLL